MAYRLMGLGYLGLGDKTEAQKSFQTSLDLKNDNLWSKFMLEKF